MFYIPFRHISICFCFYNFEIFSNDEILNNVFCNTGSIFFQIGEIFYFLYAEHRAKSLFIAFGLMPSRRDCLQPSTGIHVNSPSVLGHRCAFVLFCFVFDRVSRGSSSLDVMVGSD